jgi:hypothetical protein
LEFFIIILIERTETVNVLCNKIEEIMKTALEIVSRSENEPYLSRIKFALGVEQNRDSYKADGSPSLAFLF